MGCSNCTGVLDGHVEWSMTRNKKGHREYKIVHRVIGSSDVGVADGPFSILNTPGLPIPGAYWVIDGDVDLDAYCRRDAKVTQISKDGERSPYWLVEQLFSTEPEEECFLRVGTGTGTGDPVDDPLLKPPVISGGFIKDTIQAEYDKDSVPILNSAFEKLRGQGTVFDKSRPNVRITMNEATLNLTTLAANIDNVNDSTMWGFDPRCVKLSDITWEQKYYQGCNCYFAITYEFEINTDTFDRCVLDEGTKVLWGEWNQNNEWTLVNIGPFGLGVPPDPTNPAHFRRYVDPAGNMTRVILDGTGKPATSVSPVSLIDCGGTGGGEAGSIFVAYYPETNFILNLGIPEDLECPA